MPLKECVKCGELKELSAFHKKFDTRDGLTGSCRECNVKALRRHSRKTREFRTNLKRVPCRDCGGVFPPECMDFDHLGDKKFNISECEAFARLQQEVLKCEIVCANCHRIRTKKRALIRDEE